MSKKSDLIQPDRGQADIAVHLVDKGGFEAWAKGLSAGQRAALAAQRFDGGAGRVGIVPDGDGWFAVGGVVAPGRLSSWCLAGIAERLPAGTYRCANGEAGASMHGWQCGQYRFARSRRVENAQGPTGLLRQEVQETAKATELAA